MKITKEKLVEDFGATNDTGVYRKTLVIRLGGMAICIYERKCGWVVASNLSDSTISHEFSDEDLKKNSCEVLTTIPELVDYMMRVSHKAGIWQKIREMRKCLELQ